MAVSKAQIKATAKYESKTYDKTLVRLPKGRLDEIRTHIEPAGESLNGFIGRAISETMERDGVGTSCPQVGTSPQVGEVLPQAVKAPQEAVKGVLSPTGAGTVSLADLNGTQTGTERTPAGQSKAAEDLFGIFDDFGTVNLDEARREHLGIVYLSPDTLEAALQAAEATGEVVSDFIARAVETQTQRDQISLRMGISPVTGEN